MIDKLKFIEILIEDGDLELAQEALEMHLKILESEKTRLNSDKEKLLTLKKEIENKKGD